MNEEKASPCAPSAEAVRAAGGWVRPSSFFSEMYEVAEEVLQLPEIRVDRDGIRYPMPQLDTTIIRRKRHWWSRGGWFTVLRQYGQDRHVKLGPYPTKEAAREAEREMYAWYSGVYNVIIRTYKATERNKKDERSR